jgi:hypothetical protein
MSKRKTNGNEFSTLAADADSLLETLDAFDQMLERYLLVSGETRIKFSMAAGLGHDYFYRDRERASTHSMVKAARYIREKCAAFD